MTTPAQLVMSRFGPDTGVRVGRCASTAPAVITVSGVEVNCGFLGSYTPTLGDNVLLVRFNASWVALGSIEATA
jgi:hypothetical protein